MQLSVLRLESIGKDLNMILGNFLHFFQALVYSSEYGIHLRRQESIMLSSKQSAFRTPGSQPLLYRAEFCHL